MRTVIMVAAATALAMPAFAQSPRIVMEEMMVPASDPGIEIYVRNKRPADMTSFRPERTVLYVHGATYPASTAFDLKLDGMSWMDYIAARGYDVYLLDLRGYGKSTRPKEMHQDAKSNPPIVRGETAIKDIGSAVDFILKRRGIPRVNLIGWSWGTALMAAYTTQNASKVERLVLYAPSWIRQTPSLVQSRAGPARRLSHRAPRPGAGALDDRRARRQEGGASFPPAGSMPGPMPPSQPIRRGQGRSAVHPRAQWRDAGQRRILGGRQGLL